MHIPRSGGKTYIVSAEDTHDFAASIELYQDALLKVLFEVRERFFESAFSTYLLELWLCLRHSGCGDLFIDFEEVL
jgi:hypothetical protein